MAQIKIGDKVRYLNSVGGGVVTGFKSKEIVLVEEEDGFETPILAREVVVVPDTNEYNFVNDSPLKAIQNRKDKTPKSANSKYVASYDEVEDEIEIPIPTPEYKWHERNETKDGEQLSLYLAFVPKDIKKLQTTDMELFLINDSNYYVNFALTSGDAESRLRAQNMIEPQTKLYLETVNKLALNEFESLRFQAFAYKNIPFQIKPAMDIPLRVNPTKFYKLHSFGENDYFEADAMLLTIIKNDVMDLAMQIDPIKLQQAILNKEKAEKKTPLPQKHEKNPILEIDLHINELVDNTNGLSRLDMLNLQMETFHRVMKENIKHHGKKIVFIHGKGEGVLRAEIEKTLRKQYPKCKFYDASFQQYGFGATQVVI